MYTKKYGGQFHFDIILDYLKDKILGMRWFWRTKYALLINFERERIIVVTFKQFIDTTIGQKNSS